ncbi:MAG: transglutaminase-like domain-containing protein [Ignisphaera sp.]
MEGLGDVVRRFLDGVEGCESVDCILVRLSTAFFSMNDLARRFSLSIEELVNRFLSHPDVMKVLAGLDIQLVVKKICCDARFSNLRQHQSKIIDAIKRASQIYPPHQTHRGRGVIMAYANKHMYEGKEPRTWEYAGAKGKWKRLIRMLPRISFDFARSDIVVLVVLIVVFFVIPTTLAIMRMLSPHSSPQIAENSSSWTTTTTSEMSWVRSATLYTVTGIEGVSKSQQHVKATSVSTTTIAESMVEATSTFAISKTTITTYTIPLSFTYTTETETETLARLYPKPVLEIGKTRLAVEDGYLVVEYHGRWIPYLWIDIGNRTIHLTPHVPDNQSTAVGADYIYISSNHTVAKYKLDEIAKLLEAYRATNVKITLKPESVVCNAILTENRTLLFSECRRVILLVIPSLSGRSILETVCYEVNITAVDYLHNHLFNETFFNNPLELSRFILDWLDRNAEYNYFKAAFSLFSDVMGPVEFFEQRTGVCADYAVFTATALLAGGSDEAYILIFNTTRGWHATAGIVVNGTLYILDQHPPLYEWSEYTVHVFKPVGNKMQIMRIKLDNNGLSTIEIWTLSSDEVESWLHKVAGLQASQSS